MGDGGLTATTVHQGRRRYRIVADGRSGANRNGSEVINAARTIVADGRSGANRN